jgi:carbonic anhydrase
MEIAMRDHILERSHALRAEFFENEQELLDTLSQTGQSPDAMFIGCSDSRVVSELLTGARPGALFVARVVANIVPPYGTGQNAVGAAVEYAVLHLKVKDLIVCGHTDCGGIKALDHPVDMAAEPAIANWIEFARAAQSQVDARGLTGDARHQAIAEENVLLQLENLKTYEAVRRALDEDRVELHGWVYDLAELQIRYYDADEGRFVTFSPSTTQASE